MTTLGRRLLIEFEWFLVRTADLEQLGGFEIKRLLLLGVELIAVVGDQQVVVLRMQGRHHGFLLLLHETKLLFLLTHLRCLASRCPSAALCASSRFGRLDPGLILGIVNVEI